MRSSRRDAADGEIARCDEHRSSDKKTGKGTSEKIGE
jgi:hypothetical protein